MSLWKQRLIEMYEDAVLRDLSNAKFYYSTLIPGNFTASAGPVCHGPFDGVAEHAPAVQLVQLQRGRAFRAVQLRADWARSTSATAN